MPEQSKDLHARVDNAQTADLSSSGKNIFFAAVSTTRMPMIVTDPNQSDNPIIFANEAFLEMTGYDTTELYGRNCRFLQGSDTDRYAVSQVKRAISEERDISVEILNYRKDGSSFWNALFISPVYNEAASSHISSLLSSTLAVDETLKMLCAKPKKWKRWGSSLVA